MAADLNELRVVPDFTLGEIERPRQTARDRRERHRRQEVRRRDGAPLQHQPADCVTDCRPAPDGHLISSGRYENRDKERGMPISKKPRSKTAPKTSTKTS